jgi:threonine dehydrogenase-like Zn-dependent dehydrogenase
MDFLCLHSPTNQPNINFRIQNLFNFLSLNFDFILLVIEIFFFFLGVREVDVIGIFRYRNTWPLCIEFLKTGKIDVKPLITHRFGFSQQEVEDAFETSARGGSAIKVMFHL